MTDTCGFASCTRAPTAKGLCFTHYVQQHRGKPLTPINERLHRDSQGRVCNRCFQYKEYDDYYLKTGGGVSATCKKCVIKRVKAARRRREAKVPVV